MGEPLPVLLFIYTHHVVTVPPDFKCLRRVITILTLTHRSIWSDLRCCRRSLEVYNTYPVRIGIGTAVVYSRVNVLGQVTKHPPSKTLLTPVQLPGLSC